MGAPPGADRTLARPRPSQTPFEVLKAGIDGEALSLAIDASLAGISTTALFPGCGPGGWILGEVLRAGGVVALAAALAGVLLMNATMLSLRTSAKDLGILRAIGHGPFALATVVGVEGAITGLIGGVIGSMVAVVVVQQSATAISTEGISVVIDARWGQAMLVMVAATVLGMLAAALPAAFALRGACAR